MFVMPILYNKYFVDLSQNFNRMVTMAEEIQLQIEKEFTNFFHSSIDSIQTLAAAGSPRQYFRITYNITNTIIAVYNADTAENTSFIAFASHFAKYKLPVPHVVAVAERGTILFQTDLGDTSFYDILTNRTTTDLTAEHEAVFKSVLTNIAQFQIDAAVDFDYSKCFASSKFDERLLRWDLNYFKYYFLKTSGVNFNELQLESDFNTIVEYWNSIPSEYFLLRDCQSRNIMLTAENKPYFIDFQGGMQGPLQYDIASLLNQAKIQLPQTTKNKLLDFYIDIISQKVECNKSLFKEQYTVVSFIRLLQTLGAYGFRGLYERKPHFIQSIPPAIISLNSMLQTLPENLKIPTLRSVCTELVAIDIETKIGLKKKLKITIVSFAYKRGIPVDISGNGGGYVFDCRAIPNPGIYDEFKPLTGKDEPVIKFFKKTPEMEFFIQQSINLIDAHVHKFLNRGFSNLWVGYGCTGGQHRSVYAAEYLANYLKHTYPADIQITHVEQEMKSNQEHYLKTAQ